MRSQGVISGGDEHCVDSGHARFEIMKHLLPAECDPNEATEGGDEPYRIYYKSTAWAEILGKVATWTDIPDSEDERRDTCLKTAELFLDYGADLEGALDWVGDMDKMNGLDAAHGFWHEFSEFMKKHAAKQSGAAKSTSSPASQVSDVSEEYSVSGTKRSRRQSSPDSNVRDAQKRPRLRNAWNGRFPAKV